MQSGSKTANQIAYVAQEQPAHAIGTSTVAVVSRILANRHLVKEEDMEL